MTLRSLDQINARRIDDAGVILRVLAAVGLKLPEIGVGGVLTAEAQVAACSAAGDGFSERQIDDALVRLELPHGDRLALKISLYRHKLLRRKAA